MPGATTPPGGCAPRVAGGARACLAGCRTRLPTLFTCRIYPRPFLLRYRALNRDGRVCYSQGRGMPVFDAQGQLCRIVGNNIDVTAARAGAERLEKQDYLLRKAGTLLNFGSWDGDLPRTPSSGRKGRTLVVPATGPNASLARCTASTFTPTTPNGPCSATSACGAKKAPSKANTAS